MSTPAAPTSQRGAARDHGFHTLRIARVVAETAEASSYVLDVPTELRASYAYDAGQFITVRVHGADRLGIVAAVTRDVAAAAGNLSHLTTRLSGPPLPLRAAADQLVTGVRDRGEVGQLRSFNWQCRSAVMTPALLD